MRTKQFAIGKQVAGATWTTVYTCPADRRAIVKDLVLQNAHTAVVDTAVALWADAATYLASVARLDVHGVGKVERLERWTVVEAGQLLRVYCAVANVLYYLISGTELAL